MKTALKLTVIVFFITLFSSFAFAGRKVPLEDMKLELTKINHENLALLIWDQRPQVEDQSQPESFLGYIRSITGIAWPYFVKSGEGFSTVMLEKIQNAYSSTGIEINCIEASPSNKKEQILKKIQSYTYEKVLVIKLNKLYFDGVAKIEYVVDIEIQLYDTKGELLFSKEIIKKIKLGGSMKYKKTVPATLKNIFENALNGNDVIDAIDKKYTETKISELSDGYDIIITIDGDEIASKVLEIDKNVIKYKLHQYIEGPIRVIDRSEVFMIKYKNGDKEVFK